MIEVKLSEETPIRIEILNEIVQPGDYEEYDGSYSVTPDTSPQVLYTEDKHLRGNITVNKIPYTEENNSSGGSTVTIGPVK